MVVDCEDDYHISIDIPPHGAFKFGESPAPSDEPTLACLNHMPAVPLVPDVVREHVAPQVSRSRDNELMVSVRLLNYGFASRKPSNAA